jgi:hypothetical protein
MTCELVQVDSRRVSFVFVHVYAVYNAKTFIPIAQAYTCHHS